MNARFLSVRAMLSLYIVLMLGLASCDSPTGMGAGAGAAAGALAGGLATNRAGGAVAGAAIGAATGALIGAAVEQSDAEAYGRRPPGDYPDATRTDRKGFVLSPYAPYHEIDVRAIPRGALVRDPSCNRLFVNP